MLFAEAYMQAMTRGYLAAAADEFSVQSTDDTVLWSASHFTDEAYRQALLACRSFAGEDLALVTSYLYFLQHDAEQCLLGDEQDLSPKQHWLHLEAFHMFGKDLYNSQQEAYGGFCERYGVDGDEGIIASQLDYRANNLPREEVVAVGGHLAFV